MFEQSNTFSSLINQHFEAQLVNPDFQTFYLPKIELPRDTREDIFIFDPRQNQFTKQFNVIPLIL